MKRQDKCHTGSPAWPGANQQVTVVSLGYGPGYSHAKAGSHGFGGEKWLAKPPYRFNGHTGAAVTDGQPKGVLPGVRVNLVPRGLACGLHSVMDNIHDCTYKRVPVTKHFSYKCVALPSQLQIFQVGIGN